MGWANGQYLWLVKVRQWWWRSTILRVARWQDHPGSVGKVSGDFNPCRWKKSLTDTLSNWGFQVSRHSSSLTDICVFFPVFWGIMVSNRLFMRSAKKSALVLQRSFLVVLRESDYLSFVISVDSWIQSPTTMLKKLLKQSAVDELGPRKFNLGFNKFPHLFCWFKGLDAEDLLGCSEHRRPRLSTGAKKNAGEVVSFSIESWEICLVKTVDVLKFSVQFKLQFSVWMTLPNLKSENSFDHFKNLDQFQFWMFKIRFCLWWINLDQTCELWKCAGPGEERGRCWWNFHATELGTKIKVGLTCEKKCLEK